MLWLKKTVVLYIAVAYPVHVLWFKIVFQSGFRVVL